MENKDQIINKQNAQIQDLINENESIKMEMKIRLKEKDDKISELEEYCEGYINTIAAYQRSNERFQKKYRILISAKHALDKIVGKNREE